MEGWQSCQYKRQFPLDLSNLIITIHLKGNDIIVKKYCDRFIEKGHRSSENVYAAMEQTDSGRYLIVFFVYKSDKRALILSARDMTKSERKLYEKT